MKTYKHLFMHLMHNLLNTGSFFHLSYSALHICVCVCCCWQSGLCQYDKWPNIWDYSDKWQSPMKLTCTKLDGTLFFKVSIWLTYLGPGTMFQQARHTVHFLIISFFQVLTTHQQMHVLFLRQDTLITIKIACACKKFVLNGLFSLFPRKFITWGASLSMTHCTT